MTRDGHVAGRPACKTHLDGLGAVLGTDLGGGPLSLGFAALIRVLDAERMLSLIGTARKSKRRALQAQP